MINAEEKDKFICLEILKLLKVLLNVFKTHPAWKIQGGDFLPFLNSFERNNYLIVLSEFGFENYQIVCYLRNQAECSLS